MPSDQLVDFLEVVVKAGLIAVSAVTIAFSTGVAIALMVTRPARVTAPKLATRPTHDVAPSAVRPAAA